MLIVPSDPLNIFKFIFDINKLLAKRINNYDKVSVILDSETVSFRYRDKTIYSTTCVLSTDFIDFCIGAINEMHFETDIKHAIENTKEGLKWIT